MNPWMAWHWWKVVWFNAGDAYQEKEKEKEKRSMVGMKKWFHVEDSRATYLLYTVFTRYGRVRYANEINQSQLQNSHVARS